MLYVDGNKLRMHYGDYGVTLPIALVPCCKESGIYLLDSDTVFLQIRRGSRSYVERTATWAELQATSNAFQLELTQEESMKMLPGIYVWRVLLIREDVIRITLLRSTLEVTA